MNQNIDHTSSYGSTAVAIHQTLQSYGVNADEVLRDAGLSMAQISDPRCRIETSTFTRYVDMAMEQSGDPCFCLHFVDFIHPTTFHAFGLALLSSSTLRAFCNRFERYFTFLTTHEQCAIQEDRDGLLVEFSFDVELENKHVVNSLLEGTLATMIKFIRFMYRPDYEPREVHLMRSKDPDLTATYQQYLGHKLVFESDKHAVCLDAADLDVPLPAANAELARQNDQVVVTFLAKMDRANVPAQVHAKLIDLLPSGECSKTQIASALFMSVRTLHNKLAQAGTNYQQLLDQTRRELAEQYMKQPGISVSEIAYLLGFSDCSNFSRAFQRWTGASPSKYRDDFLEQAR